MTPEIIQVTQTAEQHTATFNGFLDGNREVIITAYQQGCGPNSNCSPYLNCCPTTGWK